MIRLLTEYYQTHMSKEQLERAADLLRFSDTDLLIEELTYSYNCYVKEHSKEQTLLITNPDALFRSAEAQAVFVAEFKKYIRDVMGIKREEVQNGKTDNNRSNGNDTKNR